MSDNKYIYKTKKEKKKCEKIINKLYGDNYYIYHTTNSQNIELILKEGILKISTNMKAEDLNFGSTFYSTRIQPYLYCSIQFDDIKNMDDKYLKPHYSLILHPKILFENDTIFNKGWKGKPTKKNNCGDIDSIMINKDDKYKIKIKKLNVIKEIIKDKLLKPRDYYNTHEFLFTKNINIKDYLIGISYNTFFNETSSHINNILEKYGYRNIPVYKNEDVPLLCDILIYN